MALNGCFQILGETIVESGSGGVLSRETQGFREQANRWLGWLKNCDGPRVFFDDYFGASADAGH
jgi:hypothetical protein